VGMRTKNNGKYTIFHLCRKIDADDAETQLSTVLPCMLTELHTVQCVVLRRIRGPDHFRSRDRLRSHYSIRHA